MLRDCGGWGCWKKENETLQLRFQFCAAAVASLLVWVGPTSCYLCFSGINIYRET